MIRIFKHPPLAFWTLALVIGGLLLSAGWRAADRTEPKVQAVTTRALSEQPAAIAMVERLSQVHVAVTLSKAEFQAWATSLSTDALSAAQRVALTKGSTDPTALAYASIARDAGLLAKVDTSKSNDVLTLQGQLGSDGDRLLVAVNGLGVPGLPGAPTSVEKKTGDNK